MTEGIEISDRDVMSLDMIAPALFGMRIFLVDGVLPEDSYCPCWRARTNSAQAPPGSSHLEKPFSNEPGCHRNSQPAQSCCT